ncbi:unnamed protein product [Mytilus coruscus]|uniref:Cyclic nucleotide-binding domain-containing protein n=1 Tax=Mytilus coruscus TaxID=42192 RepID=A0A6J8E399_MYTCO|nr:unnamed protein product [Mytilus coruscus]
MSDLQIPHLNDPGDHNKKKYDSLDFKVRVGTSLVRFGTESQAVLIQKEFQEEDKINDLIFQITSRSISRRTTPSSSRRSSIDISNGYGIQGVIDGKRAARFLRRRKDHSALLRQWNSKPEVVYEGHRNPEEALQKFRKLARTVKLLCGILITLKSYEARRVILKQGHPPLAFYIMLSGVAIVNARDVNPKTGHAFVKTVGQLVAGDTFGDFDEVIKAPLLREKEDHIEFCKEDDIIIRNSVLSKYIVIVKSGKCKLVSDFTELPSDKRRVVFDPDLEEAFPLYTTMLRVKSRAPVPKSGSTESIAHIQIGMITGTVDNTVLAAKAEKSNMKLITSQLLRETIKEHLLLEQESKLTKIEEKPRPKTTQGRQQLTGTKKEQTLNTKEIKTKSTDDNHTTLAQISQLKKGDVFGLESLVSKPSTTLSLVSEGAECILISKRLFLSEASIKVLRIVNDLVQNYPCHSYIRDQVDCYRKWVQYKHDIEEDILTSHQQKDRVWVGGVPALKCAS